MKKSLYILLLFTSGILASSNNIQIIKSHADSLYLSDNLFEAITEYKRLMFFDDEDQYGFEANFKIGMCYKYGGKFDNAIKYLKIATKKSSNSDAVLNTKLQIIRVNILRRTIPEALLLLEQDEIQLSNKITMDSVYYWKGWAYLMNDDWEMASKQFEKINSSHPLKLLADSVHGRKYSVQFAKMISLIIPGSGQFYTENYVSGFMSLGWNILWGYLTVNAFVTDRALEGILIGGLLWTRFYRGNFQNAEKFAIKRNVEISNLAYKYLAEKYFGEKP